MNKYTFPELLKERTFWKKIQDDYEVKLQDYGFEQHVLHSEVISYDPRLGNVLDDWYANRLMTKDTFPLMSGLVMTRTEHWWKNPRVLKDHDGTEYFVASFEKVMEQRRNEVLLNIIAYSVAYAGVLPYVQTAFSHTLSVAPSQLDTEYPGWQIRLDIVRSLETTSDLYDAFVFNKNPVHAVAPLSPPDTFD